VRACCGSTLMVPLDFEITAPAHSSGANIVAPQAPFTQNPQTQRLIDALGLPADIRTRRGATQQGTVPNAGGSSMAASYGAAPLGTMALPEPVSTARFTADPAGYGYAGANPNSAEAMGLLTSVTVPPVFDEEIGLDDD